MSEISKIFLALCFVTAVVFTVAILYMAILEMHYGPKCKVMGFNSAEASAQGIFCVVKVPYKEAQDYIHMVEQDDPSQTD